MQFFSLHRSPPKQSSHQSKSPHKQQQQQAIKTISISHHHDGCDPTDELTLDGMTMGSSSLSTVNLDSVIRRSVNLGGDHYAPPENDYRKIATTNNTQGSFRPLNTDDIDDRIDAYRHAVSNYREQQYCDGTAVVGGDATAATTATSSNSYGGSARVKKAPMPSSKYGAAAGGNYYSSSKSMAASAGASSYNYDCFDDEYTLAGVTVGEDDHSTYHEPRARAVFRPVESSKKPKKQLPPPPPPTMTSISSRRPPIKNSKSMMTTTTSNASRRPEQPRVTRSKSSTSSSLSSATPPKYIAPRVEQKRPSSSSSKDNSMSEQENGDGNNFRTIHKTLSMSSVETSSTQTTQNAKNTPSLLELPPSSMSMKISPKNNSSNKQLDKPRSKSSSSLSSSKYKRIHSTGLPDPYANFQEDDGLYDDPPLTEMEDSFCSTVVADTMDNKKTLIDLDTSTEDDDDTTDNSYSLDADVVVNQTDKDLMEKQGVSGALRLTTEGLKEHDRLMSGNLSPKAKDTASLHGAQYNTWSSNIEKAKRGFSRKSQPLTPSPSKMKPTNPSPTTTVPLSPNSDSVAASPCKRSPVSPPVCIVKNVKSEKTKKWGFRAIFFRPKKQTTISPFAQDLLDRERDDDLRLQRRRELDVEKSEQERIESKRRAYLEVARQKESDNTFTLSKINRGNAAKPGEAPVLSPLPLSVIDESNDDDSSAPSASSKNTRNDTPGIQNMPSLLTPSTTTTTTAAASPKGPATNSALPPCIVCQAADRTHIATPCMHFAFCGECANALQTKHVCPVCSRLDINFVQVSV